MKNREDAIENMVKALEETLRAAVWFFKGPYGSSPNENCIKQATEALEAWQKVKNEA